MRIQFIGLGNMGLPMAGNLRRAGHEVTGHDTAPRARDTFIAQGGYIAASLAEGAAAADAVITMLPAGEHVRAVYLGKEGLLRCAGRGSLLIDCSTIDVETAREVAGEAAKAGIEMLDAPVSGGTVGAQRATLTFMVGGSDAGFARAKPILAAMGKNIVHAGGPGAGQAAKICNNMILGVSMLGVCEAFVLAGRLGLERHKLFEIASTSSGSCWSLLNNCPVPGPVPTAASERDYQPGFAAALMLKDLKLSQQAAQGTGAATPMGAHAARIYEALAAAGLADKDFSVAFRFLDAMLRDRAPS
ncbi:MAG: 3-hydroxyisobutyrate dehydrogenase [Rhodospirillales bacterium]|nr:3-hydroxyisobutyrate dehydrogenase [Rhodospirillales bacterium]